MCRNFGMIGLGINIDDQKMMRDLGIVSQLNGLDGSGVYQVRSCGSTNYNYEKLHKSAKNFSSYLGELEPKKWSHGGWENGYGYTGRFDQWKTQGILESINVDIVIGHVRAATCGDISDENSHPYMFSNIVGAHNGTLKDKKYSPIGSKKTDSELMFSDMNERGIEVVLEELDRDSAFAVLIYEKNEKALYIARNHLRPLTIAFNAKRSVMYWASEGPMLKYVLERHGIYDFKSYTVAPHVLLKIKAEDVNLRNIEKDPLLCISSRKKLNRELPTEIQRQIDAQKAREKREADAKLKEEDKTKSEGEARDNVVPFQSTEKTLPGLPAGRENGKFSTRRSRRPGVFKTKDLYHKCKCGCVELNIVEASLAARDKHPDVRYDEHVDRFFCKSVGCDPLLNLKENV